MIIYYLHTQSSRVNIKLWVNSRCTSCGQTITSADVQLWKAIRRNADRHFTIRFRNEYLSPPSCRNSQSIDFTHQQKDFLSVCWHQPTQMSYIIITDEERCIYIYGLKCHTFSGRTGVSRLIPLSKFSLGCELDSFLSLKKNMLSCSSQRTMKRSENPELLGL